MDTKAAGVLGASIIIAAAIFTFGPRLLPGEKHEADVSFNVSKIEFAGVGKTESLAAVEGWPQPQATLDERFVVVKGEGPSGRYTQWIPLERVITIVSVEKAERGSIEEETAE